MCYAQIIRERLKHLEEEEKENQKLLDKWIENVSRIGTEKAQLERILSKLSKKSK